jgi:hypothetical protein
MIAALDLVYPAQVRAWARTERAHRASTSSPPALPRTDLAPRFGVLASSSRKAFIMDAPRFDRWTRSLTDTVSRRSVLGLAGAALGLAATRFPGIATAKKKHKKKVPKKLTRNSFGCVDVGKACRGNSANCCSGICDGRKPKRGKQDKSQCVAHDASTCQAGNDGEVCGGLFNIECTNISGNLSTCHTTTGNAGYCPTYVQCTVCRRDSDCEPLYQGGAACLRCAECTEGTACAGVGPA